MLRGPLWDVVAGVFIRYTMAVSTSVELLTVQISTAFTHWIERNELQKRLTAAEGEVNDLRVDIATSHNDIQTLQDDANARETEIREACEELADACNTTKRLQGDIIAA